MGFDVASFKQELEFHGEQKVREMLATDVYRHHSIKEQLAQEWLRSKETVREDSRKDKSLEIAAEANDISRSARDISRSSYRIAIIAIALTTVMAIKEVIEFLSK